jgi:tetratricopeptide (TPR) repeat protein
LAIDREATLKNAEKFLRVGRLDAAIAEYVRVVDDQPRDWNTANTLGDLYMRAGQPGKAVPLYSRVANHLLAEGFYPKAAALFRKILKITPDHEDTQLRLAEISAQLGLLADAKQYYSTIEKRRRQHGDTAGADEIVVRLGNLDPDDLDARLAAARASERNGRMADAGRQYGELYDEFLKSGREADAYAALRESVRCDPGRRASSLLPLARIELHSGDLNAARLLLGELLSSKDGAHAEILALAKTLARDAPGAAAACVGVVADAFADSGEFGRAAAALEEFSATAPASIDVLLRLVEVCVDGELEAPMLAAQAKLADAYLAAGSAAEARVIAEDLVARDPADATHVERLRRALQALNVEDIDTSISERVSSFSTIEDDADAGSQARVVPIASEREMAPDAAEPTPMPQEPLPPVAASMEIDLTGLLGELQGQAATPEPRLRPPQDLERVFSEIRAEVESGDEAEAADHFDLARTYLEMGLREEAIGSLQVAARSPRHRFAASSMIGEIYRDEGDLRAAIEWFERSIEAPAPDPEQGRALLYDLGDLLETVGETARALAVFLELNADTPDYRDVSDRAARLARVETEG